MSTTVNKNGSFALTSQGVAERQKTATEPKWGHHLVPLNLLTGSRPKQIEAPPSKRAKKAIAEGKEKKEFKISNGFRPFTGQKMGASRETIAEYIQTQLNDCSQGYIPQEHAFLILLAVNKRDIEDGAGERDLFYFIRQFNQNCISFVTA